jgi:hypothetical protein
LARTSPTLAGEALDKLSSLAAIQMMGAVAAQSLVRKNIRTEVTGKCGSRAFQE